MTANRASFWRAVPFVPQMEIVECGAACLAMVLGFFGKQVPLADLRRACGVSRDGVTALSIYRAAQDYDLEVQALKASLEDLARLPLPAIVHWEFNHFVVLEKCSRAGAVIVDPAVGRRFVPRQELDELYTGVALTFAPGARFRRSARQRCDLLRYLSVLRLCPAAVTMVLCATLAAEILGVVFPAFNQLLIDHVLKPARYGWLWPLVAILGVALLARLLLLLIRDRLLAVLQFTVDATVTTHFVRHLSQLPAEFFQHRSPGDLLQRVAANQTLRELSSRLLAAMLDGVLLLSYAALLVVYDMTLGALTIVLSVLRMGLLGLLRRQMQQATATELTLRGKELSASVESLGFPETVRAFGIEAALIERYTNRLNLRLNASVALKKTAALNQRLAQLFDGVSMAVILWMGGQAVITDQMTLGVFAGFVTLQGLLRAPLASLIDAYTQWVYARGILARLDDVIQTAVEVSGCLTMETMAGAVAFTDVSFRHGPEAPWVVQNVTLRIAPGELVAIIGPSGAGKSTLLRLLLGFLEPTQGVICVDGIALSDLDRPTWRRQVGTLLPEPCFFNDTVRANLSLYNDSLPMHVLEEAARQACIHETLQSLPEGYHTRLGERGARLSGGQRQRLALARALIGQPRLLILDEPTAALDPDTEMQVMHNLLQMDCTRILITHRLDTTRFADRIIVFDQGQVVQEGHFDDLSQRPGLFQDMLGTLCHDYSDIS